MVVFSGGGTRYAMYGGMFAALEDHGMKPGLIISTCGGSIAAAIINSFPTNEERKAYFRSEELYRFIRDIRLSEQSRLHRIGLYCLKLVCSKRKASYIRDIFRRYLVDMPSGPDIMLPSLGSAFGVHIPVVMVGSELLFQKEEVEQPRNGRKLYRKVLFTDPETAKYIDCKAIEITSSSYQDSAVDREIRMVTTATVPEAMRISLSDMFYVQPVCYENKYYAGGVVDLLPVELAEALAETIILEEKEPFTAVEEGLVRAVFGYNGNERLKDVAKNRIQYRIDTRQATRELQGHYIRKRIDWLRNRVDITLPDSYQQFAEDVDYQWQYGYRKVERMLAANSL